ncbi:hypothetical protein [Catenuloplanes japonicus]|uniref:hypothetical protein n=1 Tax=Catenuloplanes japonicus TaxID=33876 RepID=UPI000524453F|nr:hypothetical protein [Catenuloplanes japonicus]
MIIRRFPIPVAALLLALPLAACGTGDATTASPSAVPVPADSNVCCGASGDSILWQWRSYALKDGTFSQVSGERTFPPRR